MPWPLAYFLATVWQVIPFAFCAWFISSQATGAVADWFICLFAFTAGEGAAWVTVLFLEANARWLHGKQKKIPDEGS